MKFLLILLFSLIPYAQSKEENNKAQNKEIGFHSILIYEDIELKNTCFVITGGGNFSNVPQRDQVEGIDCQKGLLKNKGNNVTTKVSKNVDTENQVVCYYLTAVRYTTPISCLPISK